MGRYEDGLRNLEAVDGRAGSEVIDKLARVSPDLARYVVEYPFGDVYARPGLGLRERELVTVAALGSLGNAGPQLRVHLRGARNVGLSCDELKEVAIQLSVYAGFSAALNAMAAIGELDGEEEAASGDERIHLFVHIVPKPERFWDVREALRSHVANSLAEPGCEAFNLYEGEDEGRGCFFLNEVYRNQEALDEHSSQPYFKELSAKFEDWLSEPASIRQARRIA